MFRSLLSALAVGAVLLCSGWANAGFEFRVDSSFGAPGDASNDVSPGIPGFITVYVETTGGDIGASADSFGVNLSVAAFDGASLADISLGTPANSGTFALFNAGPGGGPTFYSTGLGTATMTARTELFTVPFTVAASVPTNGKFSFTITPGDLVNPTFLGNTGADLGATLQSPAYFINAVPEPSTLAMLGIPAIGLLLGRRRRK